MFLNFVSYLSALRTAVVPWVKEGDACAGKEGGRERERHSGGDTERERRLIAALAQFEFDGFVFVSKQEDRVSSSAGNTFQPK